MEDLILTGFILIVLTLLLSKLLTEARVPTSVIDVPTGLKGRAEKSSKKDFLEGQFVNLQPAILSAV